MKHLRPLAFCLLPLAFSLLPFAFCTAQTSAQLAADLQAADAAHWPAIQALLIAQRDELNAAHLASLTAATAEFKAKLVALTADRDESVASLTALKQRIEAELSARLAAEQATNVDGVKGPKTLLLEALIARASKSDAELKLEAAKAAEAAAVAARKAAEAEVAK